VSRHACFVVFCNALSPNTQGLCLRAQRLLQVSHRARHQRAVPIARVCSSRELSRGYYSVGMALGRFPALQRRLICRRLPLSGWGMGYRRWQGHARYRRAPRQHCWRRCCHGRRITRSVVQNRNHQRGRRCHLDRHCTLLTARRR
jgi:hypothetical protein